MSKSQVWLDGYKGSRKDGAGSNGGAWIPHAEGERKARYGGHPAKVRGEDDVRYCRRGARSYQKQDPIRKDG